jgi:hypothetical protein
MTSRNLHRRDELPLSIPWRVALQQSPPLLPQFTHVATNYARSSSQSRLTATWDSPPCLTQGVHRKALGYSLPSLRDLLLLPEPTQDLSGVPP